MLGPLNRPRHIKWTDERFMNRSLHELVDQLSFLVKIYLALVCMMHLEKMFYSHERSVSTCTFPMVYYIVVKEKSSSMDE